MRNYEPDYPPEVDDAERAKRDVVRQRIAEYFRQRLQREPDLTKPNHITGFGIWGLHQAGERVVSLCREVMKPNLQLLYDDKPSFLIADLYTAGHYFPGGAHSAVFAVYEDILLWLDDHQSNDNFEQFLRRESHSWSTADEAANFLSQTKFHYLPEPSYLKVLRTVMDIPQEEHRNFLIERQQQYPEALEKFEEGLADIASRIYPPTLTSDGEKTRFQFCVWLAVGGRVWSITCELGTNYTFSYYGELLGDRIGHYFMPR